MLHTLMMFLLDTYPPDDHTHHYGEDDDTPQGQHRPPPLTVHPAMAVKVDVRLPVDVTMVMYAMVMFTMVMVAMVMVAMVWLDYANHGVVYMWGRYDL